MWERTAVRVFGLGFFDWGWGEGESPEQRPLGSRELLLSGCSMNSKGPRSLPCDLEACPSAKCPSVESSPQAGQSQNVNPGFPITPTPSPAGRLTRRWDFLPPLRNRKTKAQMHIPGWEARKGIHSLSTPAPADGTSASHREFFKC